ncbi:hypothetical protein [Marinifilum caeruleilacunae]|uniref:Uncharacterized protein n=1 Tax=Marinifilum caeruleilacunae TaxID=2499076 RepID=A0ABX1WSL1_9BACT|nr:hypothetical protein [Marinifilum caeruleilacunae]NOU59099.1 hypothetical protein [Marinifilum caeruleilacunae]
MKTGHVILIGGALAALFYRKQLGELVSKGVNKIEEKTQTYLGTKLGFAPKDFPRVSVDIKRGAVKLKGSIELSNRTPFAATLDTYRINLVLDNKGQKISLGYTPIEYPNKEVLANSKTSIAYTFIIQLDHIAKLVQAKDLQGAQLALYVDNLKISGVNAPRIKIDISKTWQDVAKVVSNPASLLTNLFKF